MKLWKIQNQSHAVAHTCFIVTHKPDTRHIVVDYEHAFTVTLSDLNQIGGDLHTVVKKVSYTNHPTIRELLHRKTINNNSEKKVLEKLEPYSYTAVSLVVWSFYVIVCGGISNSGIIRKLDSGVFRIICQRPGFMIFYNVRSCIQLSHFN